MNRPPPAQLWQRFTAKAEAVGASVQRVADEPAAAEMITAAAPDAAGTRGLADRFPHLAARLGPIADWQAASHDVVAGGVLAVAETGSVLVSEPNRDRGACLLSERLWLLVGSDELVENLDVAFQRIGALIGQAAHHTILMTGPSRSADIERTVTVGVHGPRELRILVVGA